MDEQEADMLAEIKDAMRGECRLNIVPTFTHGDSVRVEQKVNGRWKKAGVLIFPPDGGTVADVLTMLASFRDEVSA
jgi:hypothetical protein